MNRFYTLMDLVRERQPKHVVETGTYVGKRAAEFWAMSGCRYTGFDLFDDTTDETNLREYNVKPPAPLVDVAKRLELCGMDDFLLIRGDTRETLPQWLSNEQPVFDFAFIDGGHSIETIMSDFTHLSRSIQPGGMLVLDDFYDPPMLGMGCNEIVRGLEFQQFTQWDRHPKGQVTMVMFEPKDRAEARP